MSERYVLASLYSGSRGNCAAAVCGREAVLIDAGKSLRAIQKGLSGLDISLSDIRAVFITHEHCDHTAALAALAEKTDIPIYAAPACADELSRTTGIDSGRITVTQAGGQVSAGPFSVTSFRTPHDSACSVGYRVECGGHTAALATDMGYVSREVAQALCGVGSMILESNHDIGMLENGSYPKYLKERILSRFGHLSNADCAQFSAYLEQNGTQHILLGHISDENNTRELAYECTAAALCGSACTVGVTYRSEAVFTEF